MSCERARELIIDALVEQLEGERAAELREHTAGCEACAAEADRYRALWRQLGTVAIPKPRPDALERFEARVDEELRGERDREERGWTRWAALLQKIAIVVLLVGLGAFLAVEFGARRQPAGPAPVQGGRYLLIMTSTIEPPEQSEQVGREMGAWVDSLRQQGIVESVVGLTEGPPVGTPPDGPIMADDIAGFIIIRASSPAEARRIAVQSPSIQYGGFVEIRAIN